MIISLSDKILANLVFNSFYFNFDHFRVFYPNISFATLSHTGILSKAQLF